MRDTPTGPVNRIAARGLAAAAMGLAAAPAWAHHMEGGATPTTLMDGLLSGLGHPVIGADHALFLLAIGLLAALRRRIWSLPAAFVVAMIGGVLGAVLLGDPLAVSALAPFTVVAVAVLMIAAPRTPETVLIPLALVAGLVHGTAFAQAIIGAEPTPIVAYLGGLASIQLVLTIGVALLARLLLNHLPARPVHPLRFAGVGLLAAGAFVLAA